MANNRKPKSAISIRQPYAEQILQGTKKKEYRSVPTHKLERVYIYASLTPDTPAAENMVRGKLIGTVEIVNCVPDKRHGFAYKLANPQRLARPVKPRKQPQPIWFYPF
ncbi:MAG: ASCH domain-containing protein [Bryobacterales bacterium]|nr:ASCH domain-containing protein [Bryobacterales bacterium]